MVEKKRKIIHVEKTGWTGGVDKRNLTGRATWNRESEGTRCCYYPRERPIEPDEYLLLVVRSFSRSRFSRLNVT